MDKQTFRENAKKRIDAVFDKMNELESKKDKVSAAMKASFDERLSSLKAKKKDLESTYHKLEHTAGDNWEAAQKEFSKSTEAFREGVSKLAATVQ